MDTGTWAVILIVGLIIVVAIAIADSGKTQTSEVPTVATHTSTKIPDSEVTVYSVYTHLEKFKPTFRQERKNGFTEKDVQDELEIYLKKIYYSVTREHAIEGKNVKRIDFDIGNGAVGLEVKLAEHLLKEGEGDRLLGQMQKYQNRKYNNKNLIIAVAGFDEHTTHTVIHEVKQDVEGYGGEFVFLKSKRKKGIG